MFEGIDTLLTWEFLRTFAGAAAFTWLLTECAKVLWGNLGQRGVLAVALLVAEATLIIVTIATGRKEPSDILLAALNGFVVAWAATGIAERFDKRAL